MPNASHLPGVYWPKVGLAVEAGHSLWKAFRSHFAAGQWKAANRFADLPDHLLADAGIVQRDTDWITSERVKRLRLGMNW